MKSGAISSFSTFLMLTVILFWGSSFVVVKTLLREGLTPIAIATFRFLVAGGLSLFTVLFEKKQNKLGIFLVEKGDALTLLLLALTGVTFFFTAQYTGIQMAGASVAAILVCLLSPVLITVFSAILFKEYLAKRKVLGIGVAGFGTVIVVASGTLNISGGKDFLLGSLILLATPVLWATYSLVGKKILNKYGSFLIVAYLNALGGLLLIPFSLIENSFSQIFTMSLNSWLTILYLALTCSMLGYYIWFYVINQAGAAITSSFLFAEPLVTVTFAVLFVGETLNMFTVLGGCLIFLGVYLVTRK